MPGLAAPPATRSPRTQYFAPRLASNLIWEAPVCTGAGSAGWVSVDTSELDESAELSWTDRHVLLARPISSGAVAGWSVAIGVAAAMARPCGGLS
jgi:hypothetical protein